MKKLFTKISLMAVALLFMGVSSAFADKVVNVPISQCYSITGTNSTFNDPSEIWLHSAGGYYGESQLEFTLDAEFDASKIVSATLKLYCISKSNRNDAINISTATGLTNNLSRKNCGDAIATSTDGMSKIFKYGSRNTRSYGFQGAASLTSNTLSSYTASSTTNVDVTTYVKSLTEKAAGDKIYFGLAAADAKPADLKLAGYKHTNASYLEIVYSEATLPGYTVNYKFDDATIKSVNGNSTVGSTVNAENPIVIEGQKYYATSTPLSMTIDENEANNVLNIVLRKANVYTYTLKSSVDDTVVGSGNATEGESVYVGYPAFVLSGNTLYSSAITGSEYRKSKVLTENSEDVITYTATDRTNVVYYSEAEDIDGIVPTNAGNVGARCSGALGAYVTEQTKVTTLTPGMYVISGFAWGNEGTRFRLTANGEEVAAFGSAASTVTVNSGSIFEVNTNTDIMLEVAGNAGNSPKVLDFLFIQRIPTSVPVTISDAGYATFVTPYPVDFTDNAIEAYAVSVVNANTVTLTKVTQVPADEAVIVKGESGNVNVIANAKAITNELKVATEAIEFDKNADNINYVLAQVNGNVGLYPVNEGTIADGKGYLPVPKEVAANAKGGFTFVTDNVTAVEMAEAAPTTVKNGKFATAEGIVIVKDGVKYNVAGMKK